MNECWWSFLGAGVKGEMAPNRPACASPAWEVGRSAIRSASCESLRELSLLLAEPSLMRGKTLGIEHPRRLRQAGATPWWKVWAPVRLLIPGSGVEQGAKGDLRFLLPQSTGEAQLLGEKRREAMNSIRLDPANVIESFRTERRSLHAPLRGELLERGPAIGREENDHAMPTCGAFAALAKGLLELPQELARSAVPAFFDGPLKVGRSPTLVPLKVG